jgi:hypothetical protein
MSKDTNLSLSFTAGFQFIVKLSTTDLSFRGSTVTGTSHGSRGAWRHNKRDTLGQGIICRGYNQEIL